MLKAKMALLMGTDELLLHDIYRGERFTCQFRTPSNAPKTMPPCRSVSHRNIAHLVLKPSDRRPKL